MLLLYCALAYFTGLMLGRVAGSLGLFGCDIPGWLWLLPLLLLPFLPLLDRLQPASPEPPLRWPESAGFRRPPRTAWPPHLLVGLLLFLAAGVLRYAAQPLMPCWDEGDLAYYNLPADQAFVREAPTVIVEGYVSSFPLIDGTKQRLDVTVTTLTGAGRIQPVSGVLRLTTGAGARYEYGRPVRLQGRLVTPPVFEDFSYREYLARKGIHSLMYGTEITVLEGARGGRPHLRVIYAVRAKGEEALNHLLPEPYAALANGMLLGIESGIPDELYDQFNLTGTSHVIVISGSNVALISSLLMALAARLLGRRRAVYPTLVGIALYALLVGGDAAVMRAALMGGLFVWAIALNRRSTALVSLAAACWAMTLVNPLTLWDVGFQLSSAATAGLILFTPAITAGFNHLVRGFGGPLASPASVAEIEATRQAPVTTALARTRSFARGLLEDGLLVTIAANVTTLPLVVFYFGRLSIVSLLTNLLISPVQPYIMLWGSGAVVAAVAGQEWLAQPLLWIPWLSLVWTVTMVQWTAALPGASLAVTNYGMGALLLTYALTFGLFWRQPLRRLARTLAEHWSTVGLQRLVTPVAAAALTVIALLLWRLALTQPDGRLHLHFLDVGQGDGVLITTPSGRQVLVDGGVEPGQLLAELGAVMPFWDRSLDMLLLTHPDADHMAAQVEVPARFRIDRAVNSAVVQANPAARSWYASLEEAGVPVHVQHTGGWIDLGDGVALWMLWPPPDGIDHPDVDNENSLVTKLVYGDFSALLTGDAGQPSEAVWLATGAPLQSTVLKVGHHGSKSATTPDLLAEVQPAVAVIQVGADNEYGHPDPEIVARLATVPVLRNDEHGRVHIWSDGRLMWIETERGEVTWQSATPQEEP